MGLDKFAARDVDSSDRGLGERVFAVVADYRSSVVILCLLALEAGCNSHESKADLCLPEPGPDVFAGRQDRQDFDMTQYDRTCDPKTGLVTFTPKKKSVDAGTSDSGTGR